MRGAHNVTLILPEGFTLEMFNELVSGALKTSNYPYTFCEWDGIKALESTYNSNEFVLEPISGRDVAMEFRRKK